MIVTTLQELDLSNTIVIQEEFGYRDYLWNPPFPLNDLQLYWENVPDVNFKNPTKLLPGKFLLLDTAGNEETDFAEQYQKQPHYFLHVCCNEDSYLILPDKTTIYHAGCTKGQEDITTEFYN